MGSQRFGHDWATELNWMKFIHFENNFKELAFYFANFCYCFSILVCGLVAKSWPTLCYPMECNTPGSPVLHCLLEFAQIHVQWIIESVMLFNHLILCHPLLLLHSIFPYIRVYLFQSIDSVSGSQRTGASASASVLPMNIQGWFLLWSTGLIYL